MHCYQHIGPHLSNECTAKRLIPHTDWRYSSQMFIRCLIKAAVQREKKKNSGSEINTLEFSIYTVSKIPVDLSLICHIIRLYHFVVESDAYILLSLLM